MGRRSSYLEWPFTDIFQRMPSASQIARSNPKEINRPTTWNEAFLCYPRAYLYISTSVEYSFSFGRIPSESLLPDQVRHVPSLIFGSQIPLTVDQPCAKPSQRADVDTEANCTADLSSWMLDLDGTGNDGNNHSHVPAVMLSPSQTVNLDYFDIEPVCPGKHFSTTVFFSSVYSDRYPLQL